MPPSLYDKKDDLFGRLVVEQGYITDGQLAEAKRAQSAAAGLGMRLALPDVLVSKNLITREHREEVMRVVRVQTGEARVVGGYEVVSKIGEGGMGVVYKARNTGTGEHVALKVLPPSLARDANLLKRFRREAELTRTLEHENIVRCVEFGLDRDRKLHFCALELIEGEDLAKRTAREGRLPEAEALDIARQIADALDHASSHGLIHRDIKPQNIMITSDGTAKLLDLGLARSVHGGDTRLTQTGTFAGSPHYASPEQARGERQTDVRADIYSLGATLYHTVTGETPFKGDNTAAVLAQVVSGRIAWPADVNAEVSESTCRLIARMMMRDPGDRYQTPAELLADIDIAARGGEIAVPDLARGKSPVSRPRAQAGRATRAFRPVQAKAAGAKTAYLVTALGFAAALVAGAFMLSGGGGSETRATSPPPAALPEPASVAQAPDSERERKLEEMFEFAAKHAAENPGEFERSVRYFERVRDEGRGTRFELMADSETAEVRKRWKEAARKALGEAAQRAGALAASGDFDGALALLRGLPKGLASQVDRELHGEVARVEGAGKATIGESISEAEKCLAAGDARSAFVAIEKLDGVRYTKGTRAVAARVGALRDRIAEAEKAARVRADESARGALGRLLAEFGELAAAGKYADARDWVRQAAAGDGNAPVAESLEAAARVAEALQDRLEAMRLAAGEMVGRAVTVRTGGGLRKGELEEVDGEGLALATKVIINRQVRGVTRFRIAWAELAPEQEDEFARGWEPGKPEGDLARAFIALGRGDADAAEEASREAGEHPLSGFVGEKVEALRALELEAAAEAAWREIERKAGPDGTKTSESKAKEILAEIDEFEKRYGGTRFAAGRADDLAGIRGRLGQLGGISVRLPPDRLRVELAGRATSSVQGDTLSVRVPQDRVSRAKIPLLLAGTDFRLAFSYRGPTLEMFLRKREGWRGCLLVLLAQDTMSVRTYPTEDHDHPRALALSKDRSAVSAGWHRVEAALEGAAFTLALDGRPVCATQSLPHVTGGETHILVWNTHGDSFQLRDVSFTVKDRPSGTVEGLMVGRDKAGSWIDVKGDGDDFVRRYVPVETAAGKFEPETAGELGKLFSPNRITLAWKLQAGQRRIVSFQMHLLDQGGTGTAAGTVTDRGKNWFELTPADGRRDRYIPRWIGGMPAAGGGPEQAILQAISRLGVGDRVKVGWLYDIRKRAVKIDLLQRGGGRPTARIKPGVKFRDTFEHGTGGWAVVRFVPQVIGDVSIARGQGKEGASALALRYKLEPLTLPFMMRPASDINRLSFWIRTLNRPAEVLVGVHERDDSRYQMHVHLEPGEGWKRVELDLGELKLADDAKDENGFLDFDQIKNVSIIDAAGIFGGSGDNVLLIDDAVGEYVGPHDGRE